MKQRCFSRRGKEQHIRTPMETLQNTPMSGTDPWISSTGHGKQTVQVEREIYHYVHRIEPPAERKVKDPQN